MTTQKTSYTYQDASLVVDFYAENHEDEWSNDREKELLNSIEDRGYEG